MALAVVTKDGLQYFKGKQDAANDAKFATKESVPTKVSQLSNDSNFQTGEQVQTTVNAAVTSKFTWKGTKEIEAELPGEGNAVGDIWHVNENGGEYCWNGTAWEQLGNASGLSVEWTAITGKPGVFPPEEHTHTVSQITDFPESMPASDVQAWAKAAEKPTYTYSEVGAAAAEHAHANATSSVAGFMSAEDKSKLDSTQAVEAMTTGDIDELFEQGE